MDVLFDGLVLLSALLGVRALVTGFRGAPRLRVATNRFNWYVGCLLMGLSMILWPPIIVRYAGGANRAVLFFVPLFTLGAGWYLARRAREIESRQAPATD
jgi:hypothetical protein